MHDTRLKYLHYKEEKTRLKGLSDLLDLHGYMWHKQDSNPCLMSPWLCCEVLY